MKEKFGIVFQAEKEVGLKIKEELENNPAVRMIFVEEATCSLMIVKKNKYGIFYGNRKLSD